MNYYIIHVSYDKHYHKTLRQQMHMIKNYTKPFENKKQEMYVRNDPLYQPTTKNKKNYNFNYVSVGNQSTTINNYGSSNKDPIAGQQRINAITNPKPKNSEKEKKKEKEKEKEKNKDTDKTENKFVKYAIINGAIVIGAAAAFMTFSFIRNSIAMPTSKTKGILYFPQGQNKILFDPDNYKLGNKDVRVDIDPKQFNKIITSIASQNNAVYHSSRESCESRESREFREDSQTGLQHIFVVFADIPYVTVDIKRFFQALPPNVSLISLSKLEDFGSNGSNGSNGSIDWSHLDVYLLKTKPLYPLHKKEKKNMSLSMKDEKIAEYGEIYTYHFKKFNMMHGWGDRLHRWNPFMRNIEWSPNIK